MPFTSEVRFSSPTLIVHGVQLKWRRATLLNRGLMEELREEFEQEKDKLITFLTKNASMKEPKIQVPSSVLKSLKTMK